jgi:chemotaxis protein methyltransferase CheR
MTREEFDTICRLVMQRSAIVLEPGKEYLVESRLMPIVRQLQLGSISELVARLREQTSNGLATRIVEAMVTTETLFFRDHAPFEALKKVVIPELLHKRRDERRLTVWCAASSSGQEPYSLAILLREHFPELAGWKLQLLATDLSGEMLTRAREGRYSQLEVNRGLPAPLLVKYFRQHGTTWQLQQNIRDMVDFQPLNLVETWPYLPRMDLVLIRNVMIYFDIPTKKAILGQLARTLRPDGYLLLGSAETTFNIDSSYQRVEHLKVGFYQLTG